MPGPRLYRSQSLPLRLPTTEPPTKRAKTTDDVDAIPYSRSADNLVPCGFASDDDGDEMMDGWVTATEADDSDETDLEEDDNADVNRCIECGIDMGVHNPRQYCGKTHCLYEWGRGWADVVVW